MESSGEIPSVRVVFADTLAKDEPLLSREEALGELVNAVFAGELSEGDPLLATEGFTGEPPKSTSAAATSGAAEASFSAAASPLVGCDDIGGIGGSSDG